VPPSALGYAQGMAPNLQGWAQVLTLGGMIVGALIYQTHYIDKRIDDLRTNLTGLIRSEVGGLREFVRSEIKRVEERIERLEHPVSRQP
jgi:hypothetical protein